MITWQVWIDDQEGRRLLFLDTVYNFQVSKIANTIGVCTIVIPPELESYIKPDTMLEFWRKPDGGQLRLFSVYFVRKIDFIDENGREKIVVTGYDAIELMKRRIIAYAAGSAYSQKSDSADDMIWLLVSENMGIGATDTDRSLETYLSGLGSPNQGQAVVMGFAWRNLLSICQEIAEASRQAGTELYFDWEPYIDDTSAIKFYFRTWINQPGTDRTSTVGGSVPVFFGRDYGNLVNASYQYDYSEEITVIYSGGPGEEALREVVEVEDASRSTVSPWNRREGFYDCRNATSADPTDEITTRGNSALETGRPKISFSGTLTDTYQFKFGIDWFWGDRVTCSHFDRKFDGVIKAVVIDVTDGKETLDIRIESDS